MGIEEMISGAHDDRLCGVVHANTVQGRVKSILQPEGLGVSSWGVKETTNVQCLEPERHCPPQSCLATNTSRGPTRSNSREVNRDYGHEKWFDRSVLSYSHAVLSERHFLK